ncbi:MAG TPA: hypothetical protein VFW59_03165 [Gallionella sp.]|nr:hypothetical protein [Gallionella sp.]
MPEQTAMPFDVGSRQHRVFGKQVRLQFAEDFVLRLTAAEASSLSFALVAVRDGISPEREIYMSPIGSDHEFVGTVCDSGMKIAIGKDVLALDWVGVGKLAGALAAAIE